MCVSVEMHSSVHMLLLLNAGLALARIIGEDTNDVVHGFTNFDENDPISIKVPAMLNDPKYDIANPFDWIQMTIQIGISRFDEMIPWLFGGSYGNVDAADVFGRDTYLKDFETAFRVWVSMAAAGVLTAMTFKMLTFCVVFMAQCAKMNADANAWFFTYHVGCFNDPEVVFNSKSENHDKFNHMNAAGARFIWVPFRTTRGVKFSKLKLSTRIVHALLAMICNEARLVVSGYYLLALPMFIVSLLDICKTNNTDMTKTAHFVCDVSLTDHCVNLVHGVSDDIRDWKKALRAGMAIMLRCFALLVAPTFYLYSMMICPLLRTMQVLKACCTKSGHQYELAAVKPTAFAVSGDADADERATTKALISIASMNPRK